MHPEKGSANSKEVTNINQPLNAAYLKSNRPQKSPSLSTGAFRILKGGSRLGASAGANPTF